MELRQGKNNAIVIGTLKDMETKQGITKNGDAYISVTLTVESVVNDRVHENEVKCFATSKSKLYKSYETVANEYKTKVKDGDLADRVKINGSLVFEKYLGKQDNKIKNIRKIKGLFVNRVDSIDVQDEIGAEVEVVIKGIRPEMDRDGVETGRLLVALNTVDWGNTVYEFTKTVVKEDLAPQFENIFNVGDTVDLLFNVDNYVIVEEGKEDIMAEETTVAFGTTLNNKLDSKIAKTFVNECVIIGGQMPKTDTAYTEDEVKYIDTLINLKNAELMGGAPSTPQTPAFGTGLGQQTPNTPQPQTPSYQAIDDTDIPF